MRWNPSASMGIGGSWTIVASCAFDLVETVSFGFSEAKRRTRNGEAVADRLQRATVAAWQRRAERVVASIAKWNELKGY
jgi:hypothetical protein